MVKVAKYLEALKDVADVRKYNKRQFQLRNYEEYVEAITLVQEVYIN